MEVDMTDDGGLSFNECDFIQSSKEPIKEEGLFLLKKIKMKRKKMKIMGNDANFDHFIRRHILKPGQRRRTKRQQVFTLVGNCLTNSELLCLLAWLVASAG
jgi:cyclopropane fatty-acyl-phospholipid synthase-like methyltransferase